MKSYHPVKDWRRKGSRVLWRIIESIIEEKLRRKSNKQFLNEVATDTYNKVYLIFVHQDDRQFVIVLVLTGDLMRISVMDSGGVVHSDPINIVEEPRLFLHVILGLSFADDVYLGYDPTIVKHPDGPMTIAVGNRVYTILSRVWRQSRHICVWKER